MPYCLLPGWTSSSSPGSAASLQLTQDPTVRNKDGVYAHVSLQPSSSS